MCGWQWNIILVVPLSVGRHCLCLLLINKCGWALPIFSNRQSCLQSAKEKKQMQQRNEDVWIAISATKSQEPRFAVTFTRVARWSYWHTTAELRACAPSTRAQMRWGYPAASAQQKGNWRMLLQTANLISIWTESWTDPMVLAWFLIHCRHLCIFKWIPSSIWIQAAEFQFSPSSEFPNGEPLVADDSFMIKLMSHICLIKLTIYDENLVICKKKILWWHGYFLQTLSSIIEFIFPPSNGDFTLLKRLIVNFFYVDNI